MNGRGQTRLAILGEAAALALVVVALVLPWSRDDGIHQNAFAGHAVLDVLALLSVGSGVLMSAFFAASPEAPRLFTLQSVLLTFGIPALIAGLTVTGGVDTDERQWWGPGLYVAALLAAMTIAFQLDQSRGDLRDAGSEQGADAIHSRRVVLVLPGIAALLLAGVGLTASWQQMTGPVVDALTGGDALVWRGTELSDTLALRWAVPAGFALCLLLAVIRPARRALPLALIATGVVVTVLTAAQLPDIPVQGTNAAIGIGVGAWLTLAGGVLAALCGLAALELPGAAGRPWRVAALPAVAASALLAPLVVLIPSPAGAATGDGNAQQVLGAVDGTEPRLGVPAVRAAYDRYSSEAAGSRTHLPNLAGSLDGGPGTWFVASLEDADGDDDAYLIEEIVDGRALPVTKVDGPQGEMRLLGVAGNRALVFARSYETYFVTVIDLRQGDVEASEHVPSGPYDGQAVLTNAIHARTTQALSPGGVRAERLSVAMIADGSAAVTVDPLDDDKPSATFLVDAATVRSGEPWRLTQRLPTQTVPDQVSYGTGGVEYEVHVDSISRTDPDGSTRPVVGAVSDARCTLSRDPLSSSLDEYDRQAVADRAGNLWLPLHSVDAKKRGSQLYVLTPDGVLRSAGSQWRHVLGVQSAPDGSLYVTRTDNEGHDIGATYRIRDAAAFAKRAQPLPPVADGCVSDNRVTVHTDGRQAQRLGPAPEFPAGNGRIEDSALVDPDGTTIASRYTEQDEPDEHGRHRGRWDLLRAAPGQDASVVYRMSSGRIELILADGRGGAWWFERHVVITDDDVHDGTGSLGHLDASGRARIVARDVVPAPPNERDRSVPLTVDRRNGSLWWWAQGTWHRTTLSGQTTTLRYHHDSTWGLSVAGGAGFVVEDDVVYRISANRPDLGPAVLGSESGRQLALPSAIASGAALPDVATYGKLLAASGGRLLIYQDNYLAELDDGQLRALAGPHEGLPTYSEVRNVSLVAGTLVIETLDGVIYTVDVS